MIHFDILIDASGSMGYMQGQTDEENKYLLPDGSTRTQLVKKILVNTIIPKLSFIDSLAISTFRDEYSFNNKGEKIIENNKYKTLPDLKNIYKGNFKIEEINNSINQILNPNPNGTPLWWALSVTIHQFKTDLINIIILSDGGANDKENFDEEILKTIKKINKDCKIYFIGIDQDEEAQKKSKNLAEKTNGFYVNLEIIDYDESVFNNMLFEFNTTIIGNALKENLKIEPIVIEPLLTKIENKIESNTVEKTKEDIIVEEKLIQKNVEPIDLKKQVEENTKSLQLITSQLDSIVKQISFIGKEKTFDENEFETNEDEERNRVIGYQCEKHINSIFLKNNWEKVNWLNEISERNKPYDFEITVKGINYYIECKGSISTLKEFFLTKNEWLFYLANRKNYRLYFVSEINSQNPTIHRIEDLLQDMENGKLIPCSSTNRKVKADRILFQINN